MTLVRIASQRRKKIKSPFYEETEVYSLSERIRLKVAPKYYKALEETIA